MTIKICLAGLGASLACSAVFAGPLLSEGFDDITTLAASGWVLTNNSAPPGTPWFQGNPAIFPAASGASNSYIAANWTSAQPGGNVSNWLITPQLALDNGETLNFALRLLGEGFLDTVDVYLSTNGASANVGSTDTSLGDFGVLLQSFSSSVDTGWAMQSITLSGLGAPTSGRFAFRYVARTNDTAGDYVGIDSVSVSARAVPEPGTLALATLGLGALAWRRRSRGAKLPSADPVAIS